MQYEVLLTKNAARDLEELYDYICKYDSTENAAQVLDAIENMVVSLRSLPDRGVYPMELQGLGIREYREIFFKPYRIIYRVTERQVFIYIIADGRRDFRTLLEQRLLR
jgi:toxin ParE1/3/4